jgi:hypothetical protein
MSRATRNVRAAKSIETAGSVDALTDALEVQFSHPATSSDFDLNRGVNEVLRDIDMLCARV